MADDEAALNVEEPTPTSTLRGLSSTIFRDDSSLAAPSSMIRFRSTAMVSRVYADPAGQFIIEDDRDDEGHRIITTKRVETRTAALSALRCTYTLVVVFLVGFLLVFYLELLLYLVLDLTIELGVTSKGDLHIGAAIGIVLAFPVYVYGLACALVIGVHFVEDTWSGHVLVKRFVFGRTNAVVAEWVIFAVFLGIPLLVMVVTLFARIEDWWEITSLVWLCCICFAYVVFSAAVVGIENLACFEVTRNRFDNDDDRWHQLIRRSVLLTQRNRYGGTVNNSYLAKGSIDTKRGVDRDRVNMEDTLRTHTSMYSKFIAMRWLSTDGGLGLFQKLDEPKLIFTLEDVKNERPYVTAETWSLESIYCRSPRTRYIGVFKGPQSLTDDQMRSSIVFALIGNCAVVLILSGFLVWLGLPRFAIILLVILVAVFVLYPGLKKSRQIYQMTQDIAEALESADENADDDVNATDAQEMGGAVSIEPEAVTRSENDKPRDFTLNADESQGIYQVWETYRVTTLTERMCWILFGLEFFFLFAWPLCSLFFIRNYATATLFFFIGIFSALRTYFNAAIVLEETGTLDLVDGEKGSRKHWLNMSRLSIVVTKITRSRGRGVWMGILCFVLVAYLGLCAMSVTQEGDTSSDFQFTYLPDFEYTQSYDLTYPTCTFGKGLAALGSPKTDMSDYAYLAALAYRAPDITQNELDQWFGVGVAIDNQTFVENYRNMTDGYESAVSFKLITFPDVGNLAMVCIRGTTNALDALTDAQLWSPAALFQALRFVLPAGNIWTPILHQLINVISWLASESINRVAFYRDTTGFVQYLQRSGKFGNVQVTGHSLGGGLSIITGAQTGVAAVALSGPNALLSRTSFDPPITEDALNTLTFNIIPDRDIVPRLDDVAKLNQHISCTAEFNDVVGCHDGRRSLCEIIYTCGTNNRPALCDCVTEFGYPEPTPKAGVNKTFAEECAALL